MFEISIQSSTIHIIISFLAEKFWIIMIVMDTLPSNGKLSKCAVQNEPLSCNEIHIRGYRELNPT